VKALVIGADGRIGAALAGALRRRGDVVYATSRRALDRGDRWLRLDLADPQVSSLTLPQVDMAFFCAAMTRFADCRADPERAYRTNVAGPAALAAVLAERNTQVILLSTSAVFDCRTPKLPVDAPTSPATVYGRLKADAEARILSLSSTAAVVRLTKVLTDDSPLLRGWIRMLRQRRPVQAFADHRVSPITLDYAVAGLLAVADHGKGGVYHVSGAADVSYAEIACALARRIGVAENLVHPINAVDAGMRPEEVTAFTSLDPGVLPSLTGRPPPDPSAAVESVLNALLRAEGSQESTDSEPVEAASSR
jgi:dTDP-4-dehydrorhamnose reductase